MGPKAEPAVPALIDNLAVKRFSAVRESAARALGAIGPAAKPAVSHLTPLLSDESVHVQLAVVEALARIGDKSAVPGLAQALNDEYVGISIASAKSIAKLTGREFPELYGASFSLDDNGIPILVKAAREWWINEGQYQNWQSP